MSKSVRLRLNRMNIKKLLNEHHNDLPPEEDEEAIALDQAMAKAGIQSDRRDAVLKNSKVKRSGQKKTIGLFDGTYDDNEHGEKDDGDINNDPEELTAEIDCGDSECEDDLPNLSRQDIKADRSHKLSKFKVAMQEYDDLSVRHLQKKDIHEPVSLTCDDTETSSELMASRIQDLNGNQNEPKETSTPDAFCEHQNDYRGHFRRNKRQNASIRDDAPSMRTKVLCCKETPLFSFHLSMFL